MRELIVRWTLPGGSSEVLNIMHMRDNPPIADSRAALGDFLDTMTPLLGKGTGWAIDTEGREITPETGALSGEWSDPTPYSGEAAGNATPAVANASSLLIRWKTGVIRAGRRVQGRTFIPGMRNEYLVNGDVSPALVTLVQDNLADYIATEVGPVIWCRPIEGRAGVNVNATAATVWSEWAVQRRRRG